MSLRHSLVATALACACGCGRINFDPLGGGDGGPTDGKPGDGGGPGVACVGNATPNCPTGGTVLSIFGMYTAGGSSGNRGDGLAGSCGGAGADEATVQVVVQQTGTYVFTTRDSNYDTVLYVRDGSCTGPELACNDNFGASFTSQITLNLMAGQTIIVIVDGANGLCGTYSLRAGTNP